MPFQDLRAVYAAFEGDALELWWVFTAVTEANVEAMQEACAEIYGDFHEDLRHFREAAISVDDPKPDAILVWPWLPHTTMKSR